MKRDLENEIANPEYHDDGSADAMNFFFLPWNEYWSEIYKH
jgi:hypothetical protein